MLISDLASGTSFPPWWGVPKKHYAVRGEVNILMSDEVVLICQTSVYQGLEDLARLIMPPATSTEAEERVNLHFYR